MNDNDRKLKALERALGSTALADKVLAQLKAAGFKVVRRDNFEVRWERYRKFLLKKKKVNK